MLNAGLSCTGGEKLPVVKLVDNFEAQWEYIANTATRFTFLTNLEAPRYRSAPPFPRRADTETHSRECLIYTRYIVLCYSESSSTT